MYTKKKKTKDKRLAEKTTHLDAGFSTEVAT